MSFQNIQAMRAAIDMVMQATGDIKPRPEVAGVVSHLAINLDLSASTLANLALRQMGFPQRVTKDDEPAGLDA